MDYAKDAIPSPCTTLFQKFLPDDISRLEIESLVSLGISKDKVVPLFARFSDASSFNITKKRMYILLQYAVSFIKKENRFSRLLDYRNKLDAHLERLDADALKNFSRLTILEEMEELNAWADKFCTFFTKVLNLPYIAPLSKSSQMATLKPAGQNFDQGYQAFMRKG